MGFVYYGHYATYFEVARVEALRSIGCPYKSLEDAGILMPVTEYSIRYLKPGKYDDLLKIITTIEEFPMSRTMNPETSNFEGIRSFKKNISLFSICHFLLFAKNL